MKRFHFKLSSVLTMRKFQKNEAASILSNAQNQRMRLEIQLSDTLRNKSSLEKALLECYKKSSRASDIIHLQDSLSFLRFETDVIQKKLREALECEDDCRAAVLRARQAEETVLKLLDKEKERYRQEQDREDEINMIEFVNARHHLKNV